MNTATDRARERRSLVAALVAVPARLAAATRSLPTEPPAPGEWTPAEVVRHMIAVELEVWHPRLDQLATDDHPRWPWIEPGPWADEGGASLERLLEVYAAARGATTERLAALDDPGWARTGTHATFGVLDAVGLMTRAIDHDEEHLRSFGPAPLS